MGLRSSSPFGRTPPIKPSITKPRAHPLFLHLLRDVVGATHRGRVQRQSSARSGSICASVAIARRARLTPRHPQDGLPAVAGARDVRGSRQ